VTERDLLARTADIAAGYVESLEMRPVRPSSSYGGMLSALEGPVPDGPSEPLEVVEEMARASSSPTSPRWDPDGSSAS
jgi:hypothetical protein